MSIKLLVKKKKGTKTHPDENRAVPQRPMGTEDSGETSPTHMLPIFSHTISTVLSLFRFQRKRLLEG